MAVFEITLTDGVTECRVEAEAYQQEGPLTTFYRSEGGRGMLDCWATRLASFRSAHVLMIRRRAETDEIGRADTAGTGGPALGLVVGRR